MKGPAVGTLGADSVDAAVAQRFGHPPRHRPREGPDHTALVIGQTEELNRDDFVLDHSIPSLALDRSSMPAEWNRPSGAILKEATRWVVDARYVGARPASLR